MKYFVLPYKRGSHAARVISRGIGAKQVRLVRSRWRPKLTRLLINWGHTNPPIDVGNQVLNKPEATALAVNKLAALRRMQEAGVRVPRFTDSKAEAAQWLAEKPDTVIFCRTMLRASGGRGIVIAKNNLDLVQAPLYTKRVKKQEEYRVHIFRGGVIDVAQKRLRRGFAGHADRNAYVRNFHNGWIHAHDNVVCPDSVKEISIQATQALGLDFGAVDVGLTAKGLPFVFEVNTAPGLENQQTINAYINAFNNYKLEEEQKNERQNRNNFRG